jgi:hypothetical protein
MQAENQKLKRKKKLFAERQTVKGYTPSATLVRQRAANLAALINKRKHLKLKSTIPKKLQGANNAHPQCGLNSQWRNKQLKCALHT